VLKKIGKAHRVSYEHHVQPITNGLHILHSCDTPACINPKHLREGTPKENGEDKAQRGRARTSPKYGQDNPMSRTNKARRGFKNFKGLL